MFILLINKLLQQNHRRSSLDKISESNLAVYYCLYFHLVPLLRDG